MKGITRRHLIKTALAAGLSGFSAISTSSMRPAISSNTDNTSTFDITDPWTKADEIVRNISLPNIPDVQFNISKYGAKSGGKTDSLPAIKAAIKDLVKSGGGQIVIPKGKWRVDGPIHYVSNMDLHLKEGAHLVFEGGAEHYVPLVKTRWEGTECYNFSPFIYALACSNIKLSGLGKLDGQGKQNFLPWRAKQDPDKKRLRDMGRDSVAVEKRTFGPGHYLRPQFIQFMHCSHVLIEDLTIVDSPFWVIHPTYCDQVTVRNIEIISKHINSDGVDPDSCTNVLIQGCKFDVDDDGVAIKAGRDQDAWRVGRKCQNIVVRDCEYTGSKGGGMAIGSEMSGGVSDVYVENYSIPECRHMLYFKANNDRGGEIERVYIRNIQSNYAEAVIIFTNDYHSYRGGTAPTSFKDVLMQDVRCKDSEIGLHIFGNESAPVQNVILENINIEHAQVPAQIKHVERLKMTDVKINGIDYTPALARSHEITIEPKM